MADQPPFAACDEALTEAQRHGAAPSGGTPTAPIDSGVEQQPAGNRTGTKRTKKVHHFTYYRNYV